MYSKSHYYRDFFFTKIKAKEYSLFAISLCSVLAVLFLVTNIRLLCYCSQSDENGPIDPGIIEASYDCDDHGDRDDVVKCRSRLSKVKVDKSIPQSKSGDKNEHQGGCETIHLAIVCGGYNSTRSFYVLLKSILFYRTDIIHLHLLVDNISHKILEDLFKTWDVPDLKVIYYNASNYEGEISWIPSHHYSQRFGLMKLVFLTALRKEQNLEKVIVLDTDILVLGDIKQAWREFKGFFQTKHRDAVIFGMVENQSRWYLGDSNLSGTRGAWPALGHGFNSGVILVNLLELEAQKWAQLWRYVTEMELTSYLSTSLADQDIFNAIIKLNEHIIYKLPCTFNIQLNDHANSNEICSGHQEFKIIHWNSPYKLDSKNKMTGYYKDWYFTFRNWDGKLLKRSHCLESQDKKMTGLEPKNNAYKDLDLMCQEIRPKPEDKLRTYLYFSEFEIDKIENDVTLVVHLSIDRLQVLDELASRWKGPISAALYLLELETNLLLDSISNSNNLHLRKNIGYHLAFRDRGFNYPINKLRNIALENALTPYVFLSDIDFLPPTNLYEYLIKTISEMTKQTAGDPLAKSALVIPAFENIQYKFDFPSNKIELLNQLNMGSISVFREQIWPQGHAATDYAKWSSSTKPYQVAWQPEYEPFIVTSKNVPKFDERFVGFGWNKVEHITLLAALEYQFIVLPDAFVIHKFHSASYDIMRHRESYKYRTCIKKMRKIFLTEIRDRYPNFFSNYSTAIQQRLSNRSAI